MFVNENGPGYFGTLPPHNHEKAIRLLGEIFPNDRCEAVCMSEFNEETTNRPTFGFGAYEHGCVLCDFSLWGCVEDRQHPILKRVISLFPTSSIFLVELSSVVTSFGYALYEKQELVRAHAGIGEKGITLNFGNLLEEEQPHFQRSFVRDGELFFRETIDDHDHHFHVTQFGEELAFSVARRFLGTSFNRFRGPLEVERFRCKRRSWFFW